MDKLNDPAIAIINFSNEDNVGGILRSANAAGLKEVVIVGRKKWNKGAATGAHSFTKVSRVSTSDEFLEYCKKMEYSIVSVEIGKEAVNIFDFEYPRNTILVIGSEGMGVPENILKESKGIVYIPQFGEIECLNAAASGSIAIYDWIRKKNTLKEKPIKDRKFETGETTNI